MAKLQNRNTVVAVTKETTEATPVAPSASTDYIAIQEGFDVSPEFQDLQSAELQSSIGMAKGVKGFENPTASFSHYMRSSGVEATAPNFGNLVESCLGGLTAAQAEDNTVAGSTTTVVKVDSGEGADYERGMALLVKDATSGRNYSIRNVLSVSTDDLTLAQALGAAPPVSIDLGRPTLYKVADSGHPTLDLFVYRANTAAVELLAGCRVTDMSIDATAGEFVNCSYNLSGVKYLFDPIEITSADQYLDFNDGGGEENAQVPAKFYKDPYDLAQAIADAMNALTTDTITVTYSDSTNKFTFASSGGTFSLLWNTGANTANTIGDKIGFSVAADDTGASSYVADSALTFSAPHTPSYDNADPLVAKNNEILLGSSTEVTAFEAESVSIKIANEKRDVLDICSESGKSGSIFSNRTVTVDIVGYLTSGQALEFQRYRENTSIVFTYNFGNKLGGNWVAGQCVNVHIPTAVITSFKIGDSGGVVTLEMSLRAYVDEGNGEFYINTL